jgi:hypothetical protein
MSPAAAPQRHFVDVWNPLPHLGTILEIGAELEQDEGRERECRPS